MRCHFVWDEESKSKILIPGCYGSLHREDMECCSCYDRPKTLREFEKEAYNKTVKDLREDLEYLQNEYNQLLEKFLKLQPID